MMDASTFFAAVSTRRMAMVGALDDHPGAREPVDCPAIGHVYNAWQNDCKERRLYQYHPGERQTDYAQMCRDGLVGACTSTPDRQRKNGVIGLSYNQERVTIWDANTQQLHHIRGKRTRDFAPHRKSNNLPGKLF